MWIKKKIIKILYWYVNKFKNKDRDLYVFGIIDCIQPKFFKHLNDNVSSITDMVLLYNTIYQYISIMNYCNTHLIEGIPLPLDWCRYDYRNSKLSKFLKDNNDKYIDNELFIGEFKDKLTIFVIEFNKSKQSEDLTRNHNARVLSIFNEHLINISEILIRSSIY